ncbi:MAG TPA: phosphatase PAP2 family protein [Firmicutes bacterium]|nr:phosphatase PAP2 family protein [Bacillota bacterium]
MKKRPVYASFNDALQGVMYVVRTQRNMRVHLMTGLLVVILATALGVPRVELMILLLTVGAVFIAEVINTAVEEIVNLVTAEYHPLAAVAKNVAAGAVLIAALIAVCIGYLVFIDYFLKFDSSIFRRAIPVRYLIIMTIITVIFVIVSLKARTGRGELLRGGMPSGHTAVAFVLAAAIWQTSRGWPVVAGFVLAGLVAQSRVEGKIHNWWEVAAGALIGGLITFILFQLKA